MAVFYDTDLLPKFKKAVVTIGTFDGVHLGHLVILNEVARQAREIGGESILVTFEPHPRKLLYPDQSIQIITPLDEKIQLVTKAGIDHVVVAPFTMDFAKLSAREYITQFLIRLFDPEFIIIGYDHHFGHDRTGDIELLKELQPAHRYQVIEIPAQLIQEAAVSSTKIRKALKDGEVAEASEMMGRPYSLTGIVVEGKRLGRTLGFPTANLRPISSDQIIPSIGIYAVKVEFEGQLLPGMLSIGYNPTVSNDNIINIEVHLLQFDGDLYGKRLTLQFVERLRDELKFDSLEALRQQLIEDQKATKEIFGL